MNVLWWESRSMNSLPSKHSKTHTNKFKKHNIKYTSENSQKIHQRWLVKSRLKLTTRRYCPAKNKKLTLLKNTLNASPKRSMYFKNMDMVCCSNDHCKVDLVYEGGELFLDTMYNVNCFDRLIHVESCLTL